MSNLPFDFPAWNSFGRVCVGACGCNPARVRQGDDELSAVSFRRPRLSGRNMPGYLGICREYVPSLKRAPSITMITGRSLNTRQMAREEPSS